jgi:hypothetical protein
MERLQPELTKMYNDVATFVNLRSIGIYGNNIPLITGDSWYITSARQQSLRKVFVLDSTFSGTIAHNINTSQIYSFSNIYGTIYDGTSWYPIPYVDTTLITNQISISVDATNIVITSGGTAPSIVSGLVVLEWISLT